MSLPWLFVFLGALGRKDFARDDELEFVGEPFRPRADRVVEQHGAVGRADDGAHRFLVEVGGRPVVEWVAAAVQPVTTDVLIVGRSGVLAGIACVPDDRPSRRGPLAGLATALRLADDGPVVMVAVDQPWVRAETLQGLLELAGPLHAVVPTADGARQVTCAVYPGSWADRVASEDAAGGTVQTVLDHLPYRSVEDAEWQSWGEDGRSWFSVDTEDSLREGIKLYGPPSG